MGRLGSRSSRAFTDRAPSGRVRERFGCIAALQCLTVGEVDHRTEVGEIDRRVTVPAPDEDLPEARMATTSTVVADDGWGQASCAHGWRPIATIPV